MACWSSGQDDALSRRKPGFDSRTGHWKEIRDSNLFFIFFILDFSPNHVNYNWILPMPRIPDRQNTLFYRIEQDFQSRKFLPANSNSPFFFFIYCNIANMKRGIFLWKHTTTMRQQQRLRGMLT